MKVKTTVIRILTVFFVLLFIFFVNSYTSLSLRFSPCSNREKTQDNLKQLHILMMMYAQDWDSFPKVTPEGGNGVRDLYPLYATGFLEKQNLSILQPPGVALLPFSKNPTIDEFDKDHIGVSYNSTAIPDDPTDPPLLADQGVCMGCLQLTSEDHGIKAREITGALVLFASGRTEFVRTNRQDILLSPSISFEDWKLLKDQKETNGYTTITSNEYYKARVAYTQSRSAYSQECMRDSILLGLTYSACLCFPFFVYCFLRGLLRKKALRNPAYRFSPAASLAVASLVLSLYPLFMLPGIYMLETLSPRFLVHVHPLSLSSSVIQIGALFIPVIAILCAYSARLYLKLIHYENETDQSIIRLSLVCGYTTLIAGVLFYICLG